jgi:hypothetical protein
MRPPSRANRTTAATSAATSPPAKGGAHRKKAAKAEEAASEPDDACVICGNDESDPADLIIFCDGCDTSVCQSCYLVDKVPEGDWFCRPCAAGARVKARKLDATCVLCERAGGALEPTLCGSWAHTFCCSTFEEVFFVDLPGGKSVANLANLFPERKGYACSLCTRKGGSCITCPRGNCKQAFHPYCARDRVRGDVEPWVSYVELLKNGQPVVRLCCAEHTRKLGGKPPSDIRRPSAGAAASDGADGDVDGAAAGVSGSAVGGPRLLVDSTRHRRKQARLAPSGARFIEEGLQRPADTFVLFEKAGFDKFAQSTAKVRGSGGVL